LYIKLAGAEEWVMRYKIFESRSCRRPPEPAIAVVVTSGIDGGRGIALALEMVA